MRSIIILMAFVSLNAFSDVAAGNAATDSTGTQGNTNNNTTSVYNGGGCSGTRINSSLFLVLGLGAGLWLWSIKRRKREG